MTSTATKKPYILVDGDPCVISVAYVTRPDPTGIKGVQWVGSYTCVEELNADMHDIILGIPNIFWTVEIDFQDWINPYEGE